MARTEKAKSDAPVQPKIVQRGQTEFRHDLFKSDVKEMKKNVSFRKGIVQIENIDHGHIFHSHNSQGMPQKYTSTVGGHFHEVRQFMDEDGTLRVECGPALRHKFLKKPNGQKRVIVPVTFNDQQNDKVITDNHRHDFQYLGSESLSSAKVQALQAKTQAAVKAMVVGASVQETDDGQGAGDDDGGLVDTGDEE